jgi:hypothetical protein
VSTYAPIASPVITSGTHYGPLDVTFGNFGLNFFSYERCYRGSVLSCLNGFFQGALELSFDAPTNYVSIVGDFGNDAPAVLAYGSDGSLITACGPGYGSRPDCVETFSLFGPGPYQHDARSTLSITREERDIARVVWGSFAGAAFANQITYTVAEPGTLLLVSIGLVGACGTISRRRFKTNT